MGSRTLAGGVLITGINGLIGSALAARLHRDGVDIRGLDIVQYRGGPPVDFIQADLTVPETIAPAMRGCRTVFHCARGRETPPTWQAAHAVDVRGTANLLEACRQAGVERIVHLSSISVYGPTSTPVITEDTPLWAVGFYGTCKVEAEHCVGTAVRAGVPIVTVRPGQVYGPACDGGTLSPIRWLLARRPLLVDGGHGIVHPVYLTNLVDALIAAATTDGIEGEAFNLADGNFTWREFYGYYARMSAHPLRSVPRSTLWLAGLGGEVFEWMTSRPAPFDRAILQYLTRTSTYSTEKARAVLGWSPGVSLPEAMEETERWVRAHGILPK